MLSLVGKLYLRVLIKRVGARTEFAIGRSNVGLGMVDQVRMDQVFAVRQVGEKYLANGKDVFWASVDLEKAYDTIARHSIWQISGKVRGKLMKAVLSFYVDSRACVNVGFRQDCVMSPWLFNVYMDDVVREVNVWVLGKWLELLSANGGRFEINLLLFVDDTALVADSEETLC